MPFQACSSVALAGLVTCVMACTPATAPVASAPDSDPDSAAAPQDAALGTGRLPASGFRIANGRVLSQTGENTALVEVTRLGALPENRAELRRAADGWCGRPATVSRVAQDRVGLSVTRTYLVRCR